jgi:hypothetical protein
VKPAARGGAPPLPLAEAARAPTPTDNIQSLVFSPSGAALIAGEDDCGTILVCN